MSRPGIILLDLNLPKLSGQDALREIKSNLNLRRIPVVIMSTSRREEDIQLMYDMGVNSYISKPNDFALLVEIAKSLSNYWFEIVTLPS
jgi:CheY-like chemotaxis protein